MSDDDLVALSPQQVTLTDSDAEVAPGSVERGIVSRSSSPRPASSPSPGPLLRRRSPSPAKSIPSSDGVRTVIDFVPEDAEKIEYKGKCWTLYGANKWLRSKDLHYAVQEVQFATRVGWPFASLSNDAAYQKWQRGDHPAYRYRPSGSGGRTPSHRLPESIVHFVVYKPDDTGPT